MSKILLLAGIAFSLIACSSNIEQDNKAKETGETVASSANQLPELAMQDLAGNTVHLSSFAGKKVFVNIWASWCPPCRREMPSIEKLHASVDTSKVAFVMLSVDESFADAKQYLLSSNLALPVYYPTGNLPGLFNVEGIPATFIFDEAGKMIEKVEGSDDYDTKKYRQMLQ